MTLTHLVHLAQLLLQVLLGHASQARVDHLNNLPERSHRVVRNSGAGESGELKSARKGACCARGARRTNCLRCSSRFVMNFFVRIVTAPSDMVEKYLQPQGSCGELRLATDGAGAYDGLRRGTMVRGPIAGGHRTGLHGYLLLKGSRCRGTGLGGGADSDGRPPLASPIPRKLGETGRVPLSPTSTFQCYMTAAMRRELRLHESS